MATPPTQRILGYAVSTFAKEFIFVTGGRLMQSRESMKTVEYYSVRNDQWNTAPEMNQER